MSLAPGDIATLAGLATGGFVATNLDNLLVLVLLFGANRDRRSAVLVGFLLSCCAVMVACSLGLALSSLFDPAALGLLGLAPLIMGLFMLYQLYLVKPGQQDNAEEQAARRTDSAIWISSFVLLFSNSSDSFVVFLPLLAESERTAALVLVSTYLTVAVAWGLLAYCIAGRRELAMMIERSGEKLVPWIMIGIGTYILLDTATDTFV